MRFQVQLDGQTVHEADTYDAAAAWLMNNRRPRMQLVDATSGRTLATAERMSQKSLRKGRPTGEFDEEARTITWVMTTETVDRDGETVDPAGGNFDEFMKNPTVQFNHDTDDFPIGKLVGAPWNDYIGEGTKYDIGGDKRLALLGKIMFSKENPKGDLAYRMSKEGMLGGGSISFLPIDQPQKNGDGGNHYSNWKLLEFTICPIGSNPDAVRLSLRKAMYDICQHGAGWYVCDQGAKIEFGPFDSQKIAQVWADRLNLGKSMKKRKLFVKGKKVVLLKSDGPSDEIQQYLSERGLDDVQIEDQPPTEDGFEEIEVDQMSKAIVQGEDGWYIHDESGQPVSGPYNTYAEAQAAEPKSKKAGELRWNRTGDERTAMVPGHSFNVFERNGKFVLEDNGREINSYSNVAFALQEAQRIAFQDDSDDEDVQLRSKKKTLDSGPVGLQAVQRWIKMIEDDMKGIEKDHILAAGAKAVQALQSGMSKAYGDLTTPEDDNPDVVKTEPPEDVDKAIASDIQVGDMVRSGGEMRRVRNTRVQDGTIKVTFDDGFTAMFANGDKVQIARGRSKALRVETERVSSGWHWRLVDEQGNVVDESSFPVEDQSEAERSAQEAMRGKRMKRMSKKDRALLKELDEYLAEPTRCSAAGNKYFAKELKALYEEKDLEEEVITEEDETKLEMAVKEMQSGEARLNDALYRASGKRIW